MKGKRHTAAQFKYWRRKMHGCTDAHAHANIQKRMNVTCIFSAAHIVKSAT